MINIPKSFVALKYPGYFWNTEENKLYSMKVQGILRPLRLNKGGMYQGQVFEDAYRISVNGFRKYITPDQIQKIILKNSVIPVL